MTYWIGKDVDIYMTTEQKYLAVSGQSDTSGMTATYSGTKTNIGTGDYFTIPNRDVGMAAGTKITDVTGIDFSPSTIDE